MLVGQCLSTLFTGTNFVINNVSYVAAKNSLVKRIQWISKTLARKSKIFEQTKTEIENCVRLFVLFCLTYFSVWQVVLRNP